MQDGLLPAGTYRLTLFGNNARSITDLSGLRIDGNGDDAPGGDYIRTFTVTSGIVLGGTAGADDIVLRQDGQLFASCSMVSSRPTQSQLPTLF